MTKRERAKLLRERGYTYSVIGTVLGVTAQRAHQLATGYVPPQKRALPGVHIP